MKKNISIILLSITSITYSQVKIGQSANTSLSSASVLLEFGDTKDKGIILPYVETLPSEGTPQAIGGTLIFDVSSNSEFKIKVKNQNTGWSDLSIQSGYSTAVSDAAKIPQANSLGNSTSAKVIIGAENSTADGILVLESTDKAMVLPIVEDHNAIKNPSPGMMALLKGLTALEHRLIVFNGQKWTFWRPKID